jgi:hypothetical protein
LGCTALVGDVGGDVAAHAPAATQSTAAAAATRIGTLFCARPGQTCRPRAATTRRTSRPLR